MPPLLCPVSQVGRRLTPVTILSGSVVRIWDSLERVLGRHELELNKSDRSLRIVRVDLGDGSLPLIGEPVGGWVGGVCVWGGGGGGGGKAGGGGGGVVKWQDRRAGEGRVDGSYGALQGPLLELVCC